MTLRILLDTHVALWAITNDARLDENARNLLTSQATEVWVSVATIWEISIKHGLARGNMPISGAEALAYFQESGYRILPISPEHAVVVETLQPIHSDPFDRILVAQALSEPLRLVTHDEMVARYSDTILRI